MDTVSEDFYPLNIKDMERNYPYQKVNEFYDNYYREISSQGLDGTKIDAIGWLELFGNNKGITDIYNLYCRAMDNSSKKYLRNNVIYCSSETINLFFNSFDAAVIRSSKDYIPENYCTYGSYIISNIKNSLYLGEFFYYDFDMFSSNKKGLFHAIARAISGCSIYVADNK